MVEWDKLTKLILMTFLSMRLLLVLLSALFCFDSLSQNSNPIPQREKYIDEIILPAVRLNSNIDSFINLGYRAFVIDSVSIIDKTDIQSISNFLENHPEDFIAFMQEGENHFNGDYLFSYFLNRMINVTPQFLPLCDTLLKQKKQILFFSDKFEEWKLPAEDYLTYVKIGKFLPKIELSIFEKNNPANLFSVFSFDIDQQEARIDSTFFNLNSVDAAFCYFKKTGKFPNFIFTDNPKEITELQSKIPFYFKLSILNRSGQPMGAVKYKNNENLVSYGITHLIIDELVIDSLSKFRESIEVIPQKRGYRFIPEIFTFNYNNYNQFKTIKAQRIDMSIDLKLNMPLSKKKINHTGYPVKIIDFKADIIDDDIGKTVTSFDGRESALYFDTPLIEDSEESFSIALWAKPNIINYNYPIFSKPGSYCFKIRKGMLCLTIVDIADFESKFSPVKKDTWQHFAVVYEKGKDIRFYVNGILMDIIPAIDYKTAESNFIIGSDQWDEYFKGEMSDLLFWARPIGDDEIIDLYNNGLILKGKKSLVSKISYLIIATFLLVLMAYLFWLKSKKSKKIVQSKLPQIPVVSETKNYIQCFGGFCIFDAEGKNLADKLSSKKRSFLLVILYYTFKDGGISPQKLADLFWPGYNPQRAKNVRGTYIQEIRSFIPNDILSISYKDKKWKILLNPKMYCDLLVLLKYQEKLKNNTNSEVPDDNTINPYIEIICKGTFEIGRAHV